MIQISCNEVKKYYGAELVLKSISFSANEGERIALVGNNGCGKSTLLHVITGKEPMDEGRVAIRKGARIGYLEQIPNYDNTMSVLEVIEIAFTKQHEIKEQLTQLEVLMAEKSDRELEQIMARYGRLTQEYESLEGYQLEERRNRICTGLNLSQSFLQKKFATLSGGEKTLVLLAKILLQNPDVLVLDEPTNHLDIVMLDWLEQYLKSYSGTVLVVSHDRYFLDQVATKVIEIVDGQSIEYIGNYSTYVKEKEAREANLNAAYKEQQRQLKQMEHAIKQMRDWAARADSEKMFSRAAAMQKRMDRMERVEKPKGEEKHLNLEFSAQDRSGKDVLALEQVFMSYGEHQLMKNLTFNVYFREHVAQDTVFKKVKNLSGGEKSRLKLAILMQQEINFLVLDEPTNHLDIASRESLEEALLTFQGTILFVSHDRYFINRIATRISEMESFISNVLSYLGN